jgi:hypothetical protein
MSGLNIIATQDSISAYVRQEFSNYTVYDDVLLDDEFIVKQGNKVKPYIVLQYGGLNSSPTNGSFVGVRHDEYYSNVDLCMIAPTPNQARRGLNALQNTLLGWKPLDSTPMRITSGMDILGIPNIAGSTIAYIASVRMSYNVNITDIGAYISH